MPQLFQEVIAKYEDSHQPTGEIKFDPWPHSKMKKLVHELTLTIEGPDEGKARKCLDDAKNAGLIAGVGAAFLGAGIGATEIAWKAALAALIACLGEGFEARIDDHSEWAEWWT